MEAVLVRIGTNDDLVPAQTVQIEALELLVRLGRDLHAAAQHLEQVGDDLALEDARVIRFQAVQDLAAHRNDRLEFGITRQLDGAQSGITLHDIQLSAGDILRAAVHKLLHGIGNINIAGQLFLDGKPSALGIFAGALVDQHLFRDAQGIVGVLGEIDLQLMLQEFEHRLVDKAVCDRLFRLVGIGGYGREIGGYQHQAVLDILKTDLSLALLVFVAVFEIGVDL